MGRPPNAERKDALERLPKGCIPLNGIYKDHFLNVRVREEIIKPITPQLITKFFIYNPSDEQKKKRRDTMDKIKKEIVTKLNNAVFAKYDKQAKTWRRIQWDENEDEWHKIIIQRIRSAKKSIKKKQQEQQIVTSSRDTTASATAITTGIMNATDDSTRSQLGTDTNAAPRTPTSAQYVDNILIIEPGPLGMAIRKKENTGHTSVAKIHNDGLAEKAKLKVGDMLCYPDHIPIMYSAFLSLVNAQTRPLTLSVLRMGVSSEAQHTIDNGAASSGTVSASSTTTSASPPKRRDEPVEPRYDDGNKKPTSNEMIDADTTTTIINEKVKDVTVADGDTTTGTNTLINKNNTSASNSMSINETLVSNVAKSNSNSYSTSSSSSHSQSRNSYGTKQPREASKGNYQEEITKLQNKFDDMQRRENEMNNNLKEQNKKLKEELLLKQQELNNSQRSLAVLQAQKKHEQEKQQDYATSSMEDGNASDRKQNVEDMPMKEGDEGEGEDEGENENENENENDIVGDKNKVQIEENCKGGNDSTGDYNSTEKVIQNDEDPPKVNDYLKSPKKSKEVGNVNDVSLSSSIESANVEEQTDHKTRKHPVRACRRNKRRQSEISDTDLMEPTQVRRKKRKPKQAKSHDTHSEESIAAQPKPREVCYGMVYENNGGRSWQLRFPKQGPKQGYLGSFNLEARARLAKKYAEHCMNQYHFDFETTKKLTIQAINDGNDELNVLSNLEEHSSEIPVAVSESRKRAKNTTFFDLAPQIIPETLTSNLPREEESEFYNEESAWRFYNKIEGNAIQLPPAPDLPQLPSSTTCEWSFDEASRVLLANFRKGGDNPISLDDEKFLLEMMERDDITVISEGLADNLKPNLWNPDFIAGAVGGDYYHKFRKFRKRVVDAKQLVCSEKSVMLEGRNSGEENSGKDTKCYVTYEEIDRNLSMKMSDYVRYLELRRDALTKMAAGPGAEIGLDMGDTTEPKETDVRGRATARVESETCAVNADSGANTGSDGKNCLHTGGDANGKLLTQPHMFSFKDDSGKDNAINVVDIVLYMIDFDMGKLLPDLYADFISCFKFPGALPGGSHCMMNSVNVGGRPFMGPNLYVTPPASFTHFHQDGHGTVDSGHQCLSGYNEVVMMRRLTERRKRHALYLLNGGDRKTNTHTHYDALYGLPHGDGLGEKPMWPDTTAIEECKRMRYYPSVFILKPGQLVHINKGRLHAFRKLSPDILPKADCHAKLRESLLKEENLGQTEHPCVSVAWDWMYRGVTSKGINREIVSTLECATLNRKNSKESLAIPELSLLQMARSLVSTCDLATKHWLPFAKTDNIKPSHFRPPNKEVLKGILPSLRYVVRQHRKAADSANAHGLWNNDSLLHIEHKPNSWENAEIFALDPYGNGDFFCKLCSKELSNVYMHCDGCEKILKKDFNICESCHSAGQYRQFVQMHPLNKKRHCTVNHTGDFNKERMSRCPCKNGPACNACGFCQGCSCKCHRSFTLNYRFLAIEEEEKLLSRVEDLVGVQGASETTARLEYIGLTGIAK